MARLNLRLKSIFRTHQGGRATAQRPDLELRRAVATCLLWEDTFYERGSGIAARIAALTEQVPAEVIADLAVRAREELYLRHAPLFLARQLARLHRGRLVGDVIARVIQRADELAEFLAIYWREGRQPLSAQTKRGLAEAFGRFDAYALAKYNRDGTVKLRDVLFLSHAKPRDEAQAALWKRLIDGELEAPDTWEVALSGGADKRETFTRLLRERKLGYLALLRNLRNMEEAGVDAALVREALIGWARRANRTLPFQFVAAYRTAPAFADALEQAMTKSIALAPLAGFTALVIDVSGSMDAALSGRSVLTRIDAAAALAILLREISPQVRVFTFSDALEEVPNVRGFGLLDAIHRSQPHKATWLGKALTNLRGKVTPDRLIVVTDEQAHDGLIPAWAPRAYVVNVAPYQPALDTSQGWTRVNGFSERIVDWIRVEESGEWGRRPDRPRPPAGPQRMKKGAR
jgi:hypothetical protein